MLTGVKIIGGYRELTGEEFGIYIKRVIVGGLAALDGKSLSSALFWEHVFLVLSSLTCLSVPGRLKSGDLILDVNNTSLIGVTNDR